MTQTKKLSSYTYLRYALVHPWHVVVAAGSSVFGVASWNFWHLLEVFTVSEVVILCIVLLAPAFRRYVRGQEELKAKQAAQDIKDAELAQLRDTYRSSYILLDRKINYFKEYMDNMEMYNHPAVGQCQTYLALYLRMTRELSLVDKHRTYESHGDLQNKLVDLKLKSGDPKMLEERRRLLQERISLRANAIDSVALQRQQVDYLEDLIEYTIDKATLIPSTTIPNLAQVRVNTEGTQELSILQETMAEMEEFAHIQAMEGSK